MSEADFDAAHAAASVLGGVCAEVDAIAKATDGVLAATLAGMYRAHAAEHGPAVPFRLTPEQTCLLASTAAAVAAVLVRWATAPTEKPEGEQ